MCRQGQLSITCACGHVGSGALVAEALLASRASSCLRVSGGWTRDDAFQSASLQAGVSMERRDAPPAGLWQQHAGLGYGEWAGLSGQIVIRRSVDSQPGRTLRYDSIR